MVSCGWTPVGADRAAAEQTVRVRLRSSAASQFVCNQQPLATPVCSTLCQRAPRYYLNNLNRLPNGTVLVAGGGLNATISTGNTARGSDAADLLALAAILGQLNGNDPTGQCSTGRAPSFSPVVEQALDEALTQTMAQYNVPGAVVGIWIPGGGTWVVSRGVADLATGRAMQLDDHFRIGSLTKTFTVTALLKLAEGAQPKLRLDETVDKYLPFVPNGNRITLRMLANMTSGLFNYAQDDSFYQSVLSNPQRVWTPREVVEIGFRHPPHFAPGEGWDYSNTNTVLLGMIVEQATGQRVQDVFEELIFKPLGLRQTVWPTTNALPEPYAHGFNNLPPNGKQADTTNWGPSWGGAAGQLISNLADLRIYARALGTGLLLTSEMQAERLTFWTGPPLTPTKNYGLGIRYDNGWLGHNGSIPGYSSSAFYLPAKDATIIVLTNAQTESNDFASPSIAIINALSRIVTPDYVLKGK